MGRVYSFLSEVKLIYFPNFWKYISKSPLWWLIRMRKGAKSGGKRFSMTIWLYETKSMVIWQSYGHISRNHSVAVKKNLLHSLSWAAMSKPVLSTFPKTSGVGRGALLPSPPHCMGTMKCLCLNVCTSYAEVDTKSMKFCSKEPCYRRCSVTICYIKSF